MQLKWFIVGAIIIIVAAVSLYIFNEKAIINSLNADDQIQAMQEISVVPNVTTAQKAYIPQSFGKVVGVENVGKATMIWFEAANGTVRRVQVSFWENEVILDDKVLAIRRR